MPHVPDVAAGRRRYRGVVDALTRLALAARDGDQRALDAFIRAGQADVYRFCARVASVNEAADLTQETFLRAWRSIGRFRGDSEARTWLLGIARNTVADHVRRGARRRRLRVVTSTDPHDLRNHPATGDDGGGHATAALLDDLSAERREAFVLTQMIGLSYEEAAVVCGVPVGTIRSRVARARDALMQAHRRAEAAGG